MNTIYQVLVELEAILDELDRKQRAGQNLTKVLVDLEVALNQLCYQLLEKNHQAVNVITQSDYEEVTKASLGMKANPKNRMALKFSDLITSLIMIDEKRMQIILTLLRPF